MVALFIGGSELLVIAIVILIIFGASKIPEFMRNLGKGVGEFKKGLRESEKEDEEKRK